MKIKQTVVRVLFGLGAITSLTFAALPAHADCGSGDRCCADVSTSIIQCDGSDKNSTDVTKNPIWNILLQVIDILTGGVGIVAVLGLIWGSIRWSTAGGNPSQVQQARTIITNVVIGIIAYIAMFALLNFLIPGGIFNQ